MTAAGCRSRCLALGGVIGAVLLMATGAVTAVEYISYEAQPAGAVDGWWNSVAASSDGRTLITGNTGGRLYTSTDAGVSWVERRPGGDTNRFWSAVAASGDGQILLAATALEWTEGRLYASGDGGQSWNEEQPDGNVDREWTGLACSADGLTMLAGVGGMYGGRLYILRGGLGNAWQQVYPGGDQNYRWAAAACSGDGSVLLAMALSGRVYLSRDNGVNWTDLQPTGDQTELWASAALSAFGQQIYVGTGVAGGRLYGSSDGGQSWSELQPEGDIDLSWSGLGCSGDGRGVIAVAEYGRVYASDDAGANWGEWVPAGDTNIVWQTVAVSVDGRRATVGAGPGRMFSGAITSGVSRLFYEAWDSSGAHQIWSCLEDGSGEIPIFDDGNNRYRPVVSPDGTRLAYILRSGSLSWVCTANVNGAYERFLVSSSTVDGFRSVNWHPDGTHLLYVEGSYNGGVFEPSPARDGHLYRCDTNGANVVELLSADYDQAKHYAAYAPDGAFICLGRNEQPWYAWPQNLFVCDQNGSNMVKVTNHPNGEVNKVFTCRYSPSGSRIIYQRGYSNQGNSTLWTIRQDGLNQVNTIDGTFSNEGPAYTPDGSQIIFTRYTGGRWQLARANADGSNVVLLPLSAALNRVQPCQAVVEGLPAVVGRIRVNILPERAAARGAQWQVGSGADTAWHYTDEASGWLDPADGPYNVFFSFVNDFYPPYSLHESVGGNATTNVEAVYELAGMSYIPGGTFDMGLYLGQGGHSVTLDDFRMDDHEVTVGEFQEFVAYTDSMMPAAPPWGWSNTNLPMVNVTWNDAAAYAAWAGKRLPTEAEFEYAMRGGVADQRYPWGDTITTNDANYDECGLGQPTVAGTYPYSADFLYDIAGNVNEWCYDWYESPLSGPVVNPMGPASGAYKTTRSGSWVNRKRQLYCSSRIYREPAVRYIDLGFRCAAAPSPFNQDSPGPTPNWWVLSHFGLVVGGPGGKFVAGQDSDGDGSEDGTEFAAGTDPTDPDSVLKIKRLTVLPDGTGCVVEWSSEPGKFYTLEACTHLGEGYLPVEGNIPATPPLNVYTVRGEQAAAAFYRVRLPQ